MIGTSDKGPGPGVESGVAPFAKWGRCGRSPARPARRPCSAR